MSGLANPRRRRRREPNCGMDPNFPSYEGQLCDLREAARALDLQVQELRASTDAEIDLAFETIAAAHRQIRSPASPAAARAPRAAKLPPRRRVQPATPAVRW